MILATMNYEDDQKALTIGWPPDMGIQYPMSTIWYLVLEPYLGRKFKTTDQTNQVFICPASPDGGYSGFLTYAQNDYINALDHITLMSLRDIPHPSWTVMFGETDGYDACLYADTDPYGGNVCYRHQGGNEHSVYSSSTIEGGVTGQKPKIGRANLVFLDTHVELRRNAPTNMFDPDTPFPAAP
jgi:prepilin-type processing-associated H-X9-DG protein